jgi:hypothetical protein
MEIVAKHHIKDIGVPPTAHSSWVGSFILQSNLLMFPIFFKCSTLKWRATLLWI